MDKLPVIGILVLMLLVINGYVSSSPGEEAQAKGAANAEHLDPHVSYYEQHLILMGIENTRR